MTKVLAIEDDPDIVLALRLLFERAGYQFVSSFDGRTGLRMVHEQRPDLVLLDLALPEMDGWTVLRRIRDLSNLPVLMLSAHGHEVDKVRGLRSGADDYLTKPFSNNELLARAEALLRRTLHVGDAGGGFDDGLVRINRRSRAVHVTSPSGEREVHLTNIEFRLLDLLVRNAGAVVSTGQLLAEIWSDPTGLAHERVKFAVLRLRRKLGWDNAASPIRAVRGVGYRYDGLA